MSAGGVGENLNFVYNFGEDRNDITAGDSGSFNAGFNAFGSGNTVEAGPGPISLAGSAFKDGQTVTKTNPGIAINNFRIGGATATRGQSGAVSRPQAAPAHKTGNRATKTRNTAGPTTRTHKK